MTKAKVVLKVLERQAGGGRGEMLGLLFELVMEFVLDEREAEPHVVLKMLIDTLQKAYEAGMDAVAKSSPS